MMKVWNVWLVFSDVHAVHSGNDTDAQRDCQFRACFCAIEHRKLVCRLPGADSCGVLRRVRKNRDYLKSENQLDAIVSRESSFLFNNLILLVSCVAVLSGTLFPGVFGMVVRVADQRGGAVFQQGQSSRSACCCFS